MKPQQLKEIFSQFKHNSTFKSFSELSTGHINDTYLIKTDGVTNYVLQRINHNVFKNIPALMANKVNISKHLQEKMTDLPKGQSKREVLRFLKSNKGIFYYIDYNGNYWILMVFINNSITFETVQSKDVAYEGGKLTGNFLSLTNDFEVSKLTEVIPKFHDMSFRFAQFEEALKNASKKRLIKAKKYLDLVNSLKDEMHIIQHLKESGAIRLRVTHNDTKISNILFDVNNKGLCVIDIDTVMPGIVHYDFGDAIRTICNTAAEDETDLEKVNFNLEYYTAYTKGFLEEVKPTLSLTELKYLPLGAKTMIFIMALRFLTDFLNNDIYYKTKYEEHNLDRAKNQFKLIESMSEKINVL